MQSITPVSVNVTLTKGQIKKLQEQIVDKANINKACGYAGISTRYFNRALDGGNIKSDKRDLLLSFCDLVEGKNAA